MTDQLFWVMRQLAAGTLLVLFLSAPLAAQVPDKIYWGGDIITMLESNLYAEAVAVSGERIIAVGRLRDIQQLASPTTEMIDLQGRTMLPGFIDAHGHFLSAGTLVINSVNLTPPPMGNITTIDELIVALREKADADPDAALVQGAGYDDTLLAEMRHPNRFDLDQVSTSRPVLITHISGHVAAANSMALQMAQVFADTPNPDGGRIVRNPVTGEPTGVLEGMARGLLSSLVPSGSQEQALAGLRVASELWAAAGFTTATDNVSDASQLESVYARGLDSGDLFVRLEIWPRALSLDAARAFPAVRSGTDLSGGREMITLGPLKFQIDGSPQGYTAHFSQPYLTQRPDDDGNYRGFSYWDDRDAFIDLVKALHRDGWQITVHGNGDQGIQDALDAFAEAQRDFPRQDTRHSIQHAQFTRPDQLDQMAAMGVTASFFIGHTFYWGDRHKNIFFGSHRAEHMSPLKGAQERGLRFSTHTDSPVTPIDGIQMIWSSVNRMSTGGDVIGESQRISPLQALKAITIDAAWQYFHEDIKGSIEPGKLADFVILSANPLHVGHLDPMLIKDIRVLETIVGGKTVFSGSTVSIAAQQFPN